MEVDNLASALGNPGKLQLIVYFMLCCASCFVAWNHLGMAFLGAETGHHCFLKNSSVLDEVIPKVEKDGRIEWDGCHIYVNLSTKEMRPCLLGWTYSIEGNEETIISQWDLVCDNAYKVSLASTIYFCGVIIGGLVFGSLSDKFGRRPVLLFCLYSPGILGILLFFIQDYFAFVVLRFLLGMVSQGLLAAIYITVMELFASRYRNRIATVLSAFWPIGLMSLACIAYIIQSWRYLQLFINTSTVLLIGLIWLLPESFRWLLAQKHFHRAKMVVAKIAKFNRLVFPQHILDGIVGKSEKADGNPTIQKFTVADMYRFRVLRKRSIILSFQWFSASAGFYGISLNISSLAGNKYLNFFIIGLLNLSACILTVFVTERFGRRKPLSFCLMLGSVMNIAAGVASDKGGANILTASA